MDGCPILKQCLQKLEPTSACHFLNCTELDSFDQLDLNSPTCSFEKTCAIILSAKSNSHNILNKSSLERTILWPLLDKLQKQSNNQRKFLVFFKNLYGFSIEKKKMPYYAEALNNISLINRQISIVFVDFKFEIFMNGVRINGCETLDEINGSYSSVFNSLPNVQFEFLSSEYSDFGYLCPLIFRNSKIKRLTINNKLRNRTNLIKFSKISSNLTTINSKIESLELGIKTKKRLIQEMFIF